MAKGPFKMKGNPMQRNFGIGSPLAKVTEPKDKSPDDMDQGKTVVKDDEFSVQNYQQSEYDYSKMKKDIYEKGNARDELTKRYGGDWNKKTDRYGRVTFRNQDNRTVKDVESNFLKPS